MNPTHLRRSPPAIVTIIACLTTMAQPAAAAIHDATFTGGTITATKPSVTEIFTWPPGTSCSTPSFRMDATDVHSTTTLITFWQVVHNFNLSTGPFLFVWTRSTTANFAGHLASTSTPRTITGMRVGLVLTVYNTTSCTPTGTPVCTLAASLNLSGTTTAASASGTYSLTGTTTGTLVAFPTCTAGPTQLVGTTSTVTSPLTGHFST